MPDPILLLAAHARVAVSTARKAIAHGPQSITVRRAREDIIEAATRLGIHLGAESPGVALGEGPHSAQAGVRFGD